MNDCIEIVNPEDYWDNFWGRNYLVTLSEYGPTLMVNAEHEQSALDFAADYAWEKGWEGLFLDDDAIDELIEEAIDDGYSGDDVNVYLDEYPSAGNSTLHFSSYNVSIKEVPHGKMFRLG